MILEALLTTRRPDGSPHLAPMGPRVTADFSTFELMPFQTSTTYQNLLHHPEGVLHITDNVLLLAQAAIGQVSPFPEHQFAVKIRGFVLTECCRAFEFRIENMNTDSPRAILSARVVHTITCRDFFGFNRAKHAVVEAAVLATRLHLLPPEEVAAEFARLQVLVAKTGGPAEHQAFALLNTHRQQFPAGPRDTP